MIRLLYTSTGCIQKDDPARPLINIIDASTRNNRQSGVTGLLMHGAGRFIQILEGSESEVFTLYVKLLNDPRHTDCRIMFATPIEKRAFPDWAMAAMTLSDGDFQALEEILSHRSEAVETKLLAKVMKLFMKG